MKNRISYLAGSSAVSSGRTGQSRGWLWLLLFLAVAVLAVRFAGPKLRERQEKAREAAAAAAALATAALWLDAGRVDEAGKEFETAERLIANDPRIAAFRERMQSARDKEAARLAPLIKERMAAAEQLALDDIAAAVKLLREITGVSSTPPDLAREAAERVSELTQTKCILRFPADWPGDVAVMIDGQSLRPENGELAGIEQGVRVIRFLRPGFRNPPDLSLDFRGTRPLELPAVEWKPLPGNVRLTSVPSGAAIWRNGVDTGLTTPRTIEGVDSGHVEFVLKHAGYMDAVVAGQLQAESTLELSGKLVVAPSLPREGSSAGERGEFDLSASLRIAFRWCPAGSFRMGRGESARMVNISRGFWIGETEFTQAMWESLTGDPFTTLPTGSGKGPPAKCIGSEFPACGVSWEMICGSKDREGCLVETINKHLSQSGSPWKADLPTEAQWEYACRAGGSEGAAVNAAGKVDFDSVAWHVGNSGGLFHRVASRKPNPWGIHDMQGNLHEWCADWFQESLDGLPDTDPAGPASGWKRVLRGGSCRSTHAACLPGSRAAAYAMANHPLVGFRLILRSQ